MNPKYRLFASAAAMAALCAGPALAQTNPAVGALATANSTAGAAPQDAPAAASTPSANAGQATQVQEIVVTGLRGSLQNAQKIKRNANQVVDSIVAEDIGKLPDTNIAETLQRIPGVQISRNTRGEGNAYEVHGLTQVMTTVNGRELFTVTNRTATLLDFSADILSGLDVYKTATADQIEGGLGGLINIHMARPFDFKGFHAAGTISGNYSDIHDQVTPRMSGIVSDRWNTQAGEVGLLFGAQYEQIDSGGYETSVKPYASSANFLAPPSVTTQYEYGNRTRATLYGSGQWRPTSDLKFYLDVMQSYSGGHSQTQDLSVLTSPAAATAYTTKPGSKILATGTFANAGLQSVTSSYDNPYRTFDIALGGSYTHGRLTVSGEVTYERSAGPFYDHSLTLTATAPTANVNLTGATPMVGVSGVNLLDPTNYKFGGYFDLYQYAYGSEPGVRADVKYDADFGPIKDVKVGMRYTDHTAIYDVNSFGAPSNTISTPISSIVMPTPDKVFSGRSTGVNQWLAVKWPYIINLSTARALVGAPITQPPYNPLNHYNYDEKVLSGYIMADYAFNVGWLPIDGNFGLRAVDTDGTQSSFEKNASGTIVPITGSNTYDNFLPSFNMRMKFTPDFFLRLAYSKAIARPDYNSLTPAVVLGAPTGGGMPTASAGNPKLSAMTADQYDASLEYYFGKSNELSAAFFEKDVSGFVQTFSSAQNIGGVPYLVSMPENSGSGVIRGAETDYQQFFDFLPGLWSGLGLSANFTYVDSALTAAGTTREFAAQGLSRYSYNLTGIYEKGPLSLHVSYNWRSKFIITTIGDTSGHSVYSAPLQSLDMSLTYAINRHLSFKLDAVNMLFSFQDQYYGTPMLPMLADQLDRSVEAGIHVNF